MKEAICFLSTLLSMGEWSHSTVVVMSETASINIKFAFSQRLGFHYFIWPTARVIVALLRRLHRSR